MSSITINGKSYYGNNITVVNNKVIIDGKDATPDAKEINIIVQGDITTLKVDNCNELCVNGIVNELETRNGSVTITGNVGGNVTSSNGSIKCGNVKGSVKTSNGSIKYLK